MNTREYNVGESDYSKHKIQPWDLWLEYKLNPFDADIIKRVLRHKKSDSRKMDYQKIIHICKERIRQIDEGIDPWNDDYDNTKNVINSGKWRNYEKDKQANFCQRIVRKIYRNANKCRIFKIRNKRSFNS